MARGAKTLKAARTSRAAAVSVRPVGLIVLDQNDRGATTLAKALNLACGLTDGSVDAPYDREAEKIAALQEPLTEGWSAQSGISTLSSSAWLTGPAAKAHIRNLAAALKEGFADRPLVVLNVQGTSRLALWTRALERAGAEARVAIPFCHPPNTDDIARSPGALFCWLRDSLAAEASVRDLPRCLVGYEDFVEDWRAGLDAVGRRLGLAWPGLDMAQDEIDALVAGQSRQRKAGKGVRTAMSAAYPWAVAVHGALRALEQDPSSEEAEAELDRVRQALDVASDAFRPVLAEASQTQRDHEEAQGLRDQAFEHAETALREKDAQIERLDREVGELKARLGETQDALRERSDEVQRTSGELAVQTEALQAEVERWREAARKVAEDVGAKAQAMIAETERKIEELSLARARADRNTALDRAEARELAAKRQSALEELNRAHDELVRLRRQDEAFAKREQRIAEQLEDASRDLKGAQTLVAKRETKIAELRALNVRTVEALRAAEVRGEEVETLRAALEKQKAMSQSLQTSLTLAMESPSWRITKPLRQLNAWRRKLGKQP